MGVYHSHSIQIARLIERAHSFARRPPVRGYPFTSECLSLRLLRAPSERDVCVSSISRSTNEFVASNHPGSCFRVNKLLRRHMMYRASTECAKRYYCGSYISRNVYPGDILTDNFFSSNLEFRIVCGLGKYRE